MLKIESKLAEPELLQSLKSDLNLWCDSSIAEHVIGKLLSHITALEESINNDTYCAYCGEKYPKGTPKSNNELLTEHIKVCEKHPMRIAEKRIESLRKTLIDSIFEIGGSASNNISDDFLKELPEEIRLKLESLNKEIKRLEYFEQ